MIRLDQFLTSTVGRKYLMGLSGIFLVLFTISHLAGNATLYFPDAEIFNTYAKKLHDLGPLLIIGEVGVVFTFLLHIYTGIRVTLHNKSARSERYAVSLQSKGGPSKSNFMSRMMPVSGVILMFFVLFHVWQMKFQMGNEFYMTDVGGVEARDLHQWVIEVFENPFYVLFYVGCMLLLGMHLRHGFWSAFQSLGVAYPRISCFLSLLGGLVAIALAVGFLMIPLWIHFDPLGVF
ncbi:MAG: hypothetical protein CL678_07270 [Bdellovibrionaceae bacterium]|nr:hypothetical protein [Pseudobdellovibrionaceae bacterium]|tara:strand:+ start:122 stop:823 length:702 start_codon:yes stop_codon:yes gene_type:complete